MSLTIQQLKNFFDKDDWNYDEPQEGVLTMQVEADNTKFNCVAQVREGADVMAFYTISVQPIPEEKRAAVVEFITRANYGMILGNFEVDLSDGEVRYKTVLAVSADITPDEEMFKLHVYTNIVTHDRYFPGFMQVVYAGIAPEVACQAIEAEEVDPSEMN